MGRGWMGEGRGGGGEEGGGERRAGECTRTTYRGPGVGRHGEPYTKTYRRDTGI